MPVHFEAFVPDNKRNDMMAAFMYAANDTKVLCASQDKRIVHSYKTLTDAIKGEPFGRAVYTMEINSDTKSISIIDLDVVLESDSFTKLEVLRKLPKSSDANEYYDAEVFDHGGHLRIETVNRNAFHGKLEKTIHDFKLSAFPFSVDIFNDMSEVNTRFSRKTMTNLDGKETVIAGYADEFMAPASLFHMGQESDETYTYFFGKVNSIRNVECRDLSEPFSFFIVDVVSGMGVIPVAMNPECFDLTKLGIGKVLELRADIKADLVADSAEVE